MDQEIGHRTPPDQIFIRAVGPLPGPKLTTAGGPGFVVCIDTRAEIHLNPISIFYFWFHRSLRHLLSFNSPALISSAPSILGFHHQGSYLRSSSLCSSPMTSISVPCPKASAIPRNAAALPRRASSPLAGFSQISLLKVSCSIPCCDLME